MSPVAYTATPPGGSQTNCGQTEGQRAAESAQDEATKSVAEKRVRLITSHVSRRGGLIVLWGYARNKRGQLAKVKVRAMVDTGAEADFISPSLARELDLQLEKGSYGIAVEAFGGESRIERRAKDFDFELHGGVDPGSLLSRTFSAQHTMLVAPRELSNEYNMLLGMPFINQFKAEMKMGLPNSITLRAVDGAATQFQLDEGTTHVADEETRQRAAAIARREDDDERAAEQKAAWLQELERQRRNDAAEAKRAKGDATANRIVMPLDEFEQLVRAAPEGLTVQLIVMRPDGMALNRVAHGAPADPNAKPVTKEQEEMLGQLPVGERAEAARRQEALVAAFRADVFTDELPAIDPRASPINDGVHIVLKDGAQPTGRYGPRMSRDDTEAASKMIDELLAKNFIRPSKSPWGAPMFLVGKADGTRRMVIDYRALNSATVRNRYPLPRVDELFDRLQGARYFSKIDLRTGYWQIRMAEDAIEKTAFTSRRGHFEWLVLPMGLTNAPAEFMALMEDTFRAQLNESVLVFLDDILVYSKTFEEHEAHLRAVMERLRAVKLHAKLSKCSFFREEVEFLGHYVGRAGIRMVHGKVDAIMNWPEPKTQKEVEQFVGLAGYYRKFIDGFSKVAAPLTALCGQTRAKKGAKAKPPSKRFEWGSTERAAFGALKAAVSSAPCLSLPDPDREFIVHTDASGYATGAALMQQFEDGLRPIAFLSKRMKDAETRYPIYEQELLAILNALKAWTHYLSGRKFTVWTDHEALQYIDSSPMATHRMMRWNAWFAEFDFVIRYFPGSKNVVADGLSRAAAGSERGAPAEEDDIDNENTSARDELLISPVGMEPMPVRVRTAAAADAKYQEWLHDAAARKRLRLTESSGLLYRESQDVNTGQLVVPANDELRAWLLSWAHDSIEGAHRGGDRTAAWLAARVWWPTMAEDAARYVSGCEECQRNKPDLRGRQGLPLAIQTPKYVGEIICIDFIGPLTPSARHNAIMVVIDKLSRYARYIPLDTKATAQEVYYALDARWIAEFGAPRTIISDRDSRFTSHFWEALWQRLGVELKRSTAFHPQTDGSTERQNRTLIEALRAFVNDARDDWAVALPALQRATNSAVCASTGYTPDRMVYGSEVASLLDATLEADGVEARMAHPGAQAIVVHKEAMMAAAREQIARSQAKQKRDSARGRRETEIAVGDRVWLLNKNLKTAGPNGARKLEPLYNGPFEVLEMREPNAARIKLPAASKLHDVFNVDLLRKYIDGRAEFPDRPQRYARPGAQLEEDPDAGGPGEPVYEVEAIIDARGRATRREYRVLWKGYSRDEATWERAANCIGCAELIVDYEREVAARLSATQMSIERQCEKQYTLIDAMLSTAAARVARQPETETQRAINRRAMSENVPLAADRPAVNRKGAIVMPSQRCVASTKDGRWCKRATAHSGLCWIHRLEQDGVRILKSTIEGAGKGLFAGRAFRKGEKVTRYTGDLISTRAGDQFDGFKGSKYVFEISKDWSVDAARTNTADGRMINDPKGSGERGNCEFVLDRAAQSVWIRATSAVRKGDEFFLPYGPAFWKGAKKTKTQAQRIGAREVEELDGRASESDSEVLGPVSVPPPAQRAARPRSPSSALDSVGDGDGPVRAQVGSKSGLYPEGALGETEDNPIVIDAVRLSGRAVRAINTAMAALRAGQEQAAVHANRIEMPRYRMSMLLRNRRRTDETWDDVDGRYWWCHCGARHFQDVLRCTESDCDGVQPEDGQGQTFSRAEVQQARAERNEQRSRRHERATARDDDEAEDRPERVGAWLPGLRQWSCSCDTWGRAIPQCPHCAFSRPDKEHSEGRDREERARERERRREDRARGAEARRRGRRSLLTVGPRTPAAEQRLSVLLGADEAGQGASASAASGRASTSATTARNWTPRNRSWRDLLESSPGERAEAESRAEQEALWAQLEAELSAIDEDARAEDAAADAAYQRARAQAEHEARADVMEAAVRVATREHDEARARAEYRDYREDAESTYGGDSSAQEDEGMTDADAERRHAEGLLDDRRAANEEDEEEAERQQWQEQRQAEGERTLQQQQIRVYMDDGYVDDEEERAQHMEDVGNGSQREEESEEDRNARMAEESAQYAIEASHRSARIEEDRRVSEEYFAGSSMEREEKVPEEDAADARASSRRATPPWQTAAQYMASAYGRAPQAAQPRRTAESARREQVMAEQVRSLEEHRDLTQFYIDLMAPGNTGRAITDERIAREDAWRSAPAVPWDEVQRRRVQWRDINDGGGAPQAERAVRTERFLQQNGRPEVPVMPNCRGKAAKDLLCERAHNVERVSELRQGYCRRKTCECCAPPEVVFREGDPMADHRRRALEQQFSWCSCLAVRDGFCRRCWLDFYRDTARDNRYTGPTEPHIPPFLVWTRRYQ